MTDLLDNDCPSNHPYIEFKVTVCLHEIEAELGVFFNAEEVSQACKVAARVAAELNEYISTDEDDVSEACRLAARVAAALRAYVPKDGGEVSDASKLAARVAAALSQYVPTDEDEASDEDELSDQDKFDAILAARLKNRVIN